MQHTHIIPLYAVYEFPERNFRALCMPFLGGATLASVLGLMGDQPMAKRTGRSLLDALDAAQNEVTVRVPGRGAYLQALVGASYVDAVCWLGACLADGLQYAHERGLVHLDLKPSNVLLAAAAQPLLLDFHLALHPLSAGLPAPEWLGGTPQYMSPEQICAWEAARRDRPIPKAVDGRSDVYSLGKVLYFALAERDDSPLPPLHRCNSQVSAGLSDIISKCLAERAEDRYPDAASLANDLRRHLAQLPLKGVPNRDPRERWRKWRRRRPNAALWTGLLLALVGAGVTLLAGAVDRYREAQGALTDGQDQMRRRAYAEALHTFARGKARAEGIPGAVSLTESLDHQIRLARRAQIVLDLHATTESLRFLAGAEIHTPGELRALDAQCRTAWQARDLVVNRDAASPVADPEEQVQADLLDLALFWADLKRLLAQQHGVRDYRAEVDTILTEAEELLGPCAALTRERQRLADGVNAGAPAQPATGGPTSWGRVALGQSLLRSGQLKQAAEELEFAAELRPQDFWAHFFGGVCAYRRHQYMDAVHRFGVAVALAPASAQCYYNRALAYEASGDKVHALGDYNRALALAPRLGAAALNRGVLHYKDGQYLRARSDLEQALLWGADPATVHYNLALVHLGLRDPAAARQDLMKALSLKPVHAEARSLQEHLGQQK